MEITEKIIDAVCEKIYNATIKKAYGKPNYDAIEKYLRKNVKALGYPELKKRHIVDGMREMRALSSEYEMCDIGYVMRTKAWCDAAMELGETLTDSEQEEYNSIIDVVGIAAAVFENGDFAILNPPIEHHIINDKPGEQMMLHNENGPSIRFGDGSELYTLWDVDVDKKFVMTPVDEIDTAEVLAINNVDQRAVVIRRIGVERIVDNANDIHTDMSHPHGPYQLNDMGDTLSTDKALYLRMVCASTGNVHVEGVDNDCQTVQDALNWRAKVDEMCDGRDWEPCILDGVKNPEGSPDMLQQGDVYMMTLLEMPEGGKKQKNRTLQGDNTVIRHTINEGTVYQYDGFQVAVFDHAGVMINHPQHENVSIPGRIVKIWTSREMDHIDGVIRDTLD